MRLFTFLLNRSSTVLLFAVLTGVLSGVASATLMALMNLTLAHTALHTNFMATAFVGTTMTVLFASLGSRLLLLRISSDSMLEMRMNLCGRILTSPLWRVESHGTGTLIAALTEDVLAVSDTLAEFPLLCINAAIITACLCYLFWLSWLLALLFLVTFALGVLIHELIARRTRPYLERGRETWDELIGLYHGLILGNKELKLHRQRRLAFINERLRPTADSMRSLSFTWHKLFAVAASYGQAFYFIVIGAILFGAPLLGNFGAQVLTGFTLLTIYMSGPISSIVAALPAFSRAAVALQKIEALGLSLAADKQEDASLVQPTQPAVFKELEFRGVSYVHRAQGDDQPFTLGPVNLRVSSGEVVFIVGGNGSGKSSFARILAGLYAPSDGTIWFNRQPISEQNRDEYRQHFTAIFSDYYLFDSLLGLVSDDRAEKVTRYLERLQLTRKVTLTGGKFSTLNLSQGQRKRLALLTAFLEDRDIYIFDEWAADQDPVYKDVFYHEIIPELKARGKTLIVISHDQHYYHVAERIVRFEDGAIVEDSGIAPSRSSVVAADLGVGADARLV